MRSILPALALTAVLAATGAAHAQTTPAPAPAPAASSFTDAQLAAFGKVRKQVQTMMQGVTGTPTAEQQAAMAKAVTDSGLTIEQFNAIATAAQSDRMLQARIGIASETPSAAGSVGASVTDDELGKWVAAMAKLRVVAQQVQNNTPTDAQKTEMNGIVTASGLTAERFNAISQAMQGDQHLRARAQLAEVRRGG